MLVLKIHLYFPGKHREENNRSGYRVNRVIQITGAIKYKILVFPNLRDDDMRHS